MVETNTSNIYRKRLLYLFVCAGASILSIYVSGRYMGSEELTGKVFAVEREEDEGGRVNLTLNLAENYSAPIDHVGHHSKALQVDTFKAKTSDFFPRMRSLSRNEIAEMSPPPLEDKMSNREKDFLETMKQMGDNVSYTQLEHVDVVKPFHPNSQTFPRPKLVKCDNVMFCEFENVCVADFDGTLVFASPNEDNLTWSTGKMFNGVNAGQKVRNITLPPRMGHMYFAETIFSLNCWRQKWNDRNPAHLLIGLGNMLYTASQKNLTLPKDALIVYHQCANVEGWPWGSKMERLFWDYGHESGLIGVPYAERTSRRVILPLATRHYSETRARDVFPQYEDAIICGRRFFSILETGFTNQNWLVDNKPPVINAWRAFIHDKLGFAPEPSRTKVSANETRTCQDNLRVAVWKRDPRSSTTSRRIRDETDVADLAAEYVDKSVFVLSAGKETPFAEQVANFRSFDILVTPHGSHLANLLFTKENAALIEVVTVKVDFSFQKNAVPLLRYSNFSEGHDVFNLPKGMSKAKVEKEMKKCLGQAKGCPMQVNAMGRFFKNTDLTLNFDILRRNMEDAIIALCGSVYRKRDLKLQEIRRRRKEVASNPET